MLPHILMAGLFGDTVEIFPFLMPSLLSGSLILSLLTASLGVWTRIRTFNSSSAPRFSSLLGLGIISYGGWALGSSSVMLAALPSREQRVSLFLPLWLMIIATDIGAYMGGRLLKGPKLAPWISAHKTWSGVFSGIIASMVCF